MLLVLDQGKILDLVAAACHSFIYLFCFFHTVIITFTHSLNTFIHIHSPRHLSFFYIERTSASHKIYGNTKTVTCVKPHDEIKMNENNLNVEHLPELSCPRRNEYIHKKPTKLPPQRQAARV
jgi:hypothetical protein